MVIALIVTCVILGITCFTFYANNLKLNGNLKQLKEDQEKEIAITRQESLIASRNTVRGQVSEELAPLFPGFPYNLSDCKFSGSPHDYLVFNNMSAIRDGDKTKALEIIIAEVKTNKGRPTIIQKAIKEAINNGRVRFETWRIVDNKLTINE